MAHRKTIDDTQETTGVPCELLAEGTLINRYHPLTLVQTLVFTLYLALFVYSALVLVKAFAFNWLPFSIAWGSTTLVFQLLHCGAYLFYKHQVKANARNRDKPVYLVGAPVLREIQLGVLTSTFSFMVMLYLVIQFLAFQGTGEVEHSIQVPFILLFALVALGTMYYMIAAISAQIIPVTNMRYVMVSIKTMPRGTEGEQKPLIQKGRLPFRAS